MLLDPDVNPITDPDPRQPNDPQHLKLVKYCGLFKLKFYLISSRSCFLCLVRGGVRVHAGQGLSLQPEGRAGLRLWQRTQGRRHFQERWRIYCKVE